MVSPDQHYRKTPFVRKMDCPEGQTCQRSKQIKLFTQMGSVGKSLTRNNFHHSFPACTAPPKRQDSVTWWLPGSSLHQPTQFVNETLRNLWPFIHLEDMDTKEARVNLTAPPTFLERDAGKLWRRKIIGGARKAGWHFAACLQRFYQMMKMQAGIFTCQSGNMCGQRNRFVKLTDEHPLRRRNSLNRLKASFT